MIAAQDKKQTRKQVSTTSTSEQDTWDGATQKQRQWDQLWPTETQRPPHPTNTQHLFRVL